MITYFPETKAKRFWFRSQKMHIHIPGIETVAGLFRSVTHTETKPEPIQGPGYRRYIYGAEGDETPPRGPMFVQIPRRQVDPMTDNDEDWHPTDHTSAETQPPAGIHRRP